jgi:translation initiation factor IF-3
LELQDRNHYKGIKDKKVKKEKTIQIKFGIGVHDLKTKLRNTLKFLENGHPVKMRILISGRQKDINSNERVIEEMLKWFGDASWRKYLKKDLRSSITVTKRREFYLFFKKRS